MTTFFNLAHSTTLLGSSNNSLQPYDIDICFENIRDPIAFREGGGFGGVGCTVSASAALEPQWREHFTVSGGAWLLPYIEARVAGRQFPREEMLEKFRVLHQKAPDSYESTCVRG